VGPRPSDVALADVDGDGRLDILTANSASNSVSIFRGDGRGRFAPAPGSPVPIAVAPHLVAVGTGFIAVSSHDSNDVFVIRATDPPGQLTSYRAITGVAPHNHGLAVADFNRDGAADLATSNNNGNSVSILLGDGRGRFAAAAGSPFRVGRAPYPLAVEDFDGDGKPDVATPDVNGGTVTVLRGNGRGSFAPAPGSPYRVDHRPFFALAARVNADRAPDLVISHDDISTVTVLLNDGRGRFPTSRKFDAGGQTWKLRAADFDGDGSTDLAMGLAPATLAIFFGDGAGNFRPAAGSTFRVGRGPYGVAVGDLNGDGKTDVVTANTEDGTVSVLLAVSSAAKP
jgi:hypothetical protein